MKRRLICRICEPEEMSLDTRPDVRVLIVLLFNLDSFLLENKEAIVILLLQCRSISACRKRCKLIPIFLAGNRIQFKCDVRVQLCI